MFRKYLFLSEQMLVFHFLISIIYLLFLTLQFLKILFTAAKPLQLCPTRCDPIDSSPPGSAVPGILQARIVEWVAISFSNAGKWKVKVKSLRCVRLLATLWTAAYQAPPSMGFSRQEYWVGCHCLLWFIYLWILTAPTQRVQYLTELQVTFGI